MNAQALSKLEDYSRTIAMWTSAAATMIFAGVFLTTDSNFGYQLQRLFAGKIASIDLPVFLGTILVVFFGYLIASKKRLSKVGGTISVVGVLAIYAWCELWLSHSLGPYLLALVCPALFHLASFELQRTAARKKVVAQVEAPQPIEFHGELAGVA